MIAALLTTKSTQIVVNRGLLPNVALVNIDV
jgi:hypothetical protein